VYVTYVRQYFQNACVLATTTADKMGVVFV